MPKYTLYLIDNNNLQAEHDFDFTDGNIFNTSVTHKNEIEENSGERQVNCTPFDFKNKLNVYFVFHREIHHQSSFIHFI